MSDKPQFYKEYQHIASIDQAERRLIGAKTQLSSIKTSLENIKAVVDADQDATADMVTLANQANSLVNNVGGGGFLTFIQNTLE